jgi:hypothetical protein
MVGFMLYSHYGLANQVPLDWQLFLNLNLSLNLNLAFSLSVTRNLLHEILCSFPKFPAW